VIENAMMPQRGESAARVHGGESAAGRSRRLHYQDLTRRRAALPTIQDAEERQAAAAKIDAEQTALDQAGPVAAPEQRATGRRCF
jgi:hypothetical protein